MKDTPKSEAQLHAEERLAHETTHVQFLTTNRKGQKLVNYDNQQLAIRPEVFLSKDEQTIICYHPPPKLYPVSYTKPAVGEAWWRPGKENLVKYGGELTSEQIEEVKTLRRENPKLWTITALSNLLEAKPEAIRPHARLSEQQIKELDVERDLYDSLPASKRRLYRQKQTSERVDYVLRTRGSPQAQMFRSREMVAGWRQKIPPA